MSGRSPSQRAAEKGRAQKGMDQQVMDQELAIAEDRGAERVRAQVRGVLAERRRVVRLGDAQIEVVEVSALTEVLGGEPE